MNEEEVVRAIEALEDTLEVDDPDLSRRLERLQRGDTVHTVVVFTLLAISAVLIATGLGAVSFTIWALGLGALGLSAVIHRTYQWRLGRTR